MLLDKDHFGTLSDEYTLAFIRGLLENVGAEIDPIRLIRRIKNGLEIPGLKEALIKILQTFHLQISLMEGCQTILDGDSTTLAKKFHKDQSKGFFQSGKSIFTFRMIKNTINVPSYSRVKVFNLLATSLPGPRQCDYVFLMSTCCAFGMCKWG